MQSQVPGAHYPASLTKSMSSVFNKRSCLKEIRQRTIEDTQYQSHVLHIHVCIHVNIYNTPYTYNNT